MNARSFEGRPAVEAVEGRGMMSAVAYGDFDNDGLVDMAALTSPTTITVSLAKADGGYAVSAVLATPKNRPAVEVYVADYDGDGTPDVSAVGGNNGGGWVVHRWLGNGDGTFGSRTTETFRFKLPHGGF